MFLVGPYMDATALNHNQYGNEWEERSIQTKNANSESRMEPKCVGVGQPVFLQDRASAAILEEIPAFCATLLSTEKCKSATNRD